jgi:uncharacterized protein involved in exopolysaccharide biosynthesis
MVTNGEVKGDPLRAAVSLVRRRIIWGIGVAAVVFAIAGATILFARPVYRAEARLRLGEPPPSAGVSPTGGLLNMLRLGGDPFSNDLELLASRTIAETLVQNLALSVRLEAPRSWHRDSMFVALALSPSDTTERGAYQATWDEPEWVTVERTAPEREPVGRFRAGEPASFGGMDLTFATRRADGPESVTIRTVPFGEAVSIERGRLDVRRTRREANVLEIRYQHHDPAIAAGAVREAVDGFLRLRTRLFRQESGETVDSLRVVAQQTREELRLAEEALEALQSDIGLVAPEPQSEALIERYEVALAGLLQARIEEEAIATQLARVGSAPDRMAAWSTLLAHPRFLENETLSSLVERLTTLEELRTQALSTRQPESREVRTLEEQIAQLDQGLRTLVAEYRSALNQTIVELQGQLDELDTLIRGLPSQVVDLGRRQRDVRVLSEVVVLTEQRLRQEELRQAMAYSNVQVIDPPALQFRPVWPRRGLGLRVGMLAAVLSGLLAMVLVERADATLRTSPRIRAMTGAPVLAAPIAHNGTRELKPVEVDALKRVATRGCAVVFCEGAEEGAKVVANALGESVRLGPSAISAFADASAVSKHPVLLVIAAGETSEDEVQRVTHLLREAGAALIGTVVACDSPRDVRALWR